MLLGGRQTHIADGILRGENTMLKVKDTDVYVAVLTPDSDNCSITFDEHLAALLEDVEDPGQQMAVCDALCNIGLAEHKMYVRDNNKFQKHDYKSTKAMRKLAKEYLYSTKHWPIPGNR